MVLAGCAGPIRTSAGDPPVPMQVAPTTAAEASPIDGLHASDPEGILRHDPRNHK